MMGLRTAIRHLPALTVACCMVGLLGACNSQPAKYRHSNDCKCPKWNHVPKPPSGSEHADGHPAATPYHCSTGSHS
ncbi:MAG: hypothetical protein KF797_01865 [Flavobacteriales bacterium]|nr:hypothetical protein [Flavobacteriales bacterium]